MKKYLSLVVVVLLLACAGSAFAADAGHGSGGTEIEVSKPTPTSFELTETKQKEIAGGFDGVDENTPVVDMTKDPDVSVSDGNSISTTEIETIDGKAKVNGNKPKVVSFIGKLVTTVRKIVTTLVDTAKMNPGDTLNYVGTENPAPSSSEVKTAASTTQAKFLDKDGKEITKVPDDKIVNLAILAEPGVEYTMAVAAGEINPGTSDPGSSGGGCSAGFTVLALAVLGGFIAARKK